jgi:hypothetical protein
MRKLRQPSQPARLRACARVAAARAFAHLHLVVDDALVGERLLDRVELEVPALLLQHERVVGRARVQHGVEVHVHQVVEILFLKTN